MTIGSRFGWGKFGGLAARMFRWAKAVWENYREAVAVQKEADSHRINYVRVSGRGQFVCLVGNSLFFIRVGPHVQSVGALAEHRPAGTECAECHPQC